MGAWMIQPSWIQAALAQIQAGLWKPAPLESEKEPRVYESIDMEKSAKADGRHDLRLYYPIHNSIAVIPLAGAMQKARSKFGGVSTVDARRSIRHAVSNENVDAIMMLIDSPGGHTAGTAELADEVQRADTIKPVYAHIDDLGASAAYWVASQARRITANRMAQVGSIGCVAVIKDTSKAHEAQGVKVHVISTGKYKGSFADGAPVTKDDLAYIQSMVDDFNDHFLGSVMSGRNMSQDEVEAISTGEMWIADKALKNGLIDAVQSSDQTILEIGSELAAKKAEEFEQSRIASNSDIVAMEIRFAEET